MIVKKVFPRLLLSSTLALCDTAVFYAIRIAPPPPTARRCAERCPSPLSPHISGSSNPMVIRLQFHISATFDYFVVAFVFFASGWVDLRTRGWRWARHAGRHCRGHGPGMPTLCWGRAPAGVWGTCPSGVRGRAPQGKNGFPPLFEPFWLLIFCFQSLENTRQVQSPSQAEPGQRSLL